MQRRLRREEEEEALAAVAAAAKAVASHATVDIETPQVELESNEWIRLLNAPPKRTGIVVCFPGIGQNHTAYQSWGAALEAEGVQLCAVCLPGRSNRAGETRFRSVQNCATAVFLAMKGMGMLERLLPELEKEEEQEQERSSMGGDSHTHTAEESFEESAEGEVRLSPLILVGNSVGAMVAFEVGRHMCNYRYHLSALFVAGAPSAYVQGLDRLGKKWCFLSDQELIDRMVELGGVPLLLQSVASRSLLRRFVPLFRGDYYLLDKYQLGPPAMDGFTAESELAVKDEGAVVEVRKKYTAVVDDPWAKKPKPTKSTKPGTPAEEEEPQQLTFPAALYRLKAALVTIRAEDDVFASAALVAEWQFLTKAYDHIALEGGTGGHFMSLFHPQNRELILEEIFSFCQLRG
jgi:surfactin synthase thioesterase subunit